MKILIMGQHYAPEDVSGGVLATELATDLIMAGHQVTFATSAPSYPQGRVFAGYRNRLYQVQMVDGVRVVRTWSFISRSRSFWSRILNYGTFSASAFYGGWFSGKPDVILSASPPFPLGLSAWLLSRLWRVPWVLRVEDLFPEAAITTGAIRNSVVIRSLELLERFFYEKATQISVLSDGFKNKLIAKNIPAQKICVIPVWADPNQVKPMDKLTAFREQQKLQSKFIVLYAGNMGLTSALEDVLEAARLLKEEIDLHFVFVGEGVKKNSLQVFAQKHRLENVTFLPFLVRSEFPELLASADLSLVTLNTDSATTSLPSKIFNYLASARPILAIAPPESELGFLVRESKCGEVVQPGAPRRIAESILGLRKDPIMLGEMGLKGRYYLETRYSRQNCTPQFEKLLRQEVAQKPWI